MELIKFICGQFCVIPAMAAVVILLTDCKKKFSEEHQGVTVNVKTLGAVGDGTTDDTWAFNKAIDQVAADGGTVYVPVGTYLINPDVSIIMKSNVILDMVDSMRIIQVKPSSLLRYNVIRMHKISNAQVNGGKIIGERYQHIGTEGEWGAGITLYEATNCKVIRTVITDCWGDGIVVGSQSSLYNAPNASVNCVISGVQSRNNRRQGLTIGGVDSLIIDSCKFTYTNGTAPQAGIDIEPDKNTAERVYIKNCEIAYNAKVGIEMNAKSGTPAIIRKVTVEGNYIHHNTYSAYIQNVSYVKMYYNILTFNDWNGPAAGGNGNVPYTVNATYSVFTPNTY